MMHNFSELVAMLPPYLYLKNFSFVLSFFSMVLTNVNEKGVVSCS